MIIIPDVLCKHVQKSVFNNNASASVTNETVQKEVLRTSAELHCAKVYARA